MSFLKNIFNFSSTGNFQNKDEKKIIFDRNIEEISKSSLKENIYLCGNCDLNFFKKNII